jgi:hypothetical protein
MAHELFNFWVAERRDFAVRDQLQPNAAGTAWVENIPMLMSNFPKTNSHERNPTYSVFLGRQELGATSNQLKAISPQLCGSVDAVCCS